MEGWRVEYFKRDAIEAHRRVVLRSLGEFKAELARHKKSGSDELLRVFPPALTQSEIDELKSLGFSEM
jgi:hypothetical protein